MERKGFLPREALCVYVVLSVRIVAILLLWQGFGVGGFDVQFHPITLLNVFLGVV